MKPYLLGQGVYAFVDGSYCCPALYVPATDTTAVGINPLFLSWKQQDQLIMSALLSSLSTEILHLVVDCDTSHSIWQTLEKSFASPSHSRIMQLHGSFQDLRQGDDSVTAFLQRAKVLFDELAAAGRPLSLEDFNLYVFRGLRSDFKDLVTSLSTRAEPLSYSDLHSYLLTHEYLNKSSLQSTLGSTMTAPLLPTPSAFSVQRGGFGGASGNSYRGRGRGRHRGGWRGYRGGNHGNSGSGWQSMSGSGFQQHSRGIPNSNHNFRNVKCQLCYAFGHSAKYCSQFTSQHLQATANLAFRNPQLSSTGWFPDTGANQHVTPDLASMTGSEPYLGSDQLHVGDGKGLVISHISQSKLYTPKRTFILSNVLHVPHIKKPLLSVQKFCIDNNVFFEFHSSVFYVKDLITKEVLLSGQSSDGLYVLSASSATRVPQAFLSTSVSSTAEVWHRRLGHPSSRILGSLVSNDQIACNSRTFNFNCSSCPLGKASRLSLRPTGHKTCTPLELIFSDVWGPSPMLSNDGYRYFVIFVDAHTKYIWFFPLTAKSDVFKIFLQFQALVERQFTTKIKSVQTD